MKTKGFNLIKMIIILSIFGIIAAIIIPAFGRFSARRSGCCMKITEVFICVGHKYSSECRVQLENGKRVTINELVAVGDDYCGSEACLAEDY